jgi:acetyl esterase/lipase
VTNAETLADGPLRIVVTGDNAGGGLPTSLALMARDRRKFKVAGLLLNCPKKRSIIAPDASMTSGAIRAGDNSCGLKRRTSSAGKRCAEITAATTNSKAGSHLRVPTTLPDCRRRTSRSGASISL